MSNTILITGSSSGIGKTTAKYFQEKGWNVVATMRTPEKETELSELDNVLVTRLDVQDPDSIARAVQQGIETFGKIDVLLNNAGFGAFGILEAVPVEKIRRQFDVNVIGLIETTRAILPHFRANRSAAESRAGTCSRAGRPMDFQIRRKKRTREQEETTTEGNEGNKGVFSECLLRLVGPFVSFVTFC